MKVSVQAEDFDVNAELIALRQQNNGIGAIVSFVGLVREWSDDDKIESMTLEHYPGMTEKALTAIAKKAESRWQLSNLTIIHRIGTLKATDQIVLVATASPHRHDAFQACEFVMDYLKTQAPFWKKEVTQAGERWVDARKSDETAQARWE